MSAPPPRLYLAPMSNERLLGHALAVLVALLAAMVLRPDGQESGVAFATLALAATGAVVLWNAAAIGLRSTTHDGRWALGNAAFVALAFVGSFGAYDAGYAFVLPATPHLWLHLFIALVGGSILVAKERVGTSRQKP